MKGRKLLLSILILFVFGCLVYLFFYPSDSNLGKPFTLFIILIGVYYVGLVSGFGALLLRVFKLIKVKNSLLYILAGTLNVFIALIGIALFLLHKADMDWLHKSLANLFVGFLILADVFVLHAPNKP